MIWQQVRPQARLRCVSWGAGRLWRPSSADRGGSRDKSFCPCQKTGGNSGFLPVFFLHVLHGNGVRFGSDSGFSHLVLPVLNCFHPLQHPKRTRFCLFWVFPGAFFSFLLVHGRKIFGFVFVQIAICWLQIEVIGDSTQPGCILLDVVQLRDLTGAVAQQFENLA